MRFASDDVRDHMVCRKNDLRTFVCAVRSLAALEKSKNRLSRDFWSRSIFAFATQSREEQTWSFNAAMSAFDRFC